jgi:hypothetical protein
VRYSETQQKAIQLVAAVRRVFSLADTPRLFLVFFAFGFQILAHILAVFSPEGWQPLFTSLSVTLWVIFFAVVFMMAIPAIDRWLSPYLKHLRRGAIGVGLVLFIMGIVEAVGINLLNEGGLQIGGGYIEEARAYSQLVGYNDSTAMIHMASEELLEANNPYTEVNLVEACDDFKVPAEKLTPLKDGTFAETFPYPTDEEIARVWQEAKANSDTTPVELEGKLNYPAGSFLFFAPFLALGLHDLRYFYLLCALLMFAVIMWQSPRKLWPLVVLAAAASLGMWNDIAFGGTGGLYLLFLLLSWIMLPKNLWLSAVFMGLAATSKQLAWFFIPFYLVLLLRQVGWRRSLQLSGVIAGVFFVTNVPFILNAPEAWAESLLAPLVDPMFPGGIGVVVFSIRGLIPSGTSVIYMGMEIVILVVCLIWYYRNCRKYPETGLVLAVLPLFFAWRSYPIYFYPAAILVFAAVLASRGKSILPQALTGKVKPVHNMDNALLTVGQS